jgi:mannose-1-phosphate guanylyltransferase
MSINIILPVIMVGDSGSHLWSLSRQKFPKQFLTLHSEYSMLQAIALRLTGLKQQAAMIICNEEHRFSLAEQFRANSIANSGIILEPVGRNTAPAHSTCRI